MANKMALQESDLLFAAFYLGTIVFRKLKYQIRNFPDFQFNSDSDHTSQTQTNLLKTAFSRLTRAQSKIFPVTN